MNEKPVFRPEDARADASKEEKPTTKDNLRNRLASFAHKSELPRRDSFNAWRLKYAKAWGLEHGVRDGGLLSQQTLDKFKIDKFENPMFKNQKEEE